MSLNERLYRLNVFFSSPVYGSQVKRLGFARAFLGANAMCSSLPMFMLLHLICVEFVLQRLITPILSLEKTPTRYYVILDRHQIAGLSWLDKVSCLFCGYANGQAVLMNEKLVQMAGFDPEGRWWGRAREGLAILLTALFFPLYCITHLVGIELLYGVIISRLLGMHRTVHSDIKAQVLRQGFPGNKGPVYTFFLCHGRVTVLRLLALLEQIESSWCPFKHLEKDSRVRYPAHHKNLFEPHEVMKASQVLEAEGTVSPLRPFI